MATRIYRIDNRKLIRHMKHAVEFGASYPVALKIGPYSFTEWSVEGKPAIYVALHNAHSAGSYLGRIVKGKLYPTEVFRIRRDLRPIRAFVENPLHAAAAAAKTAEKPVCACCSRPLGTRDVKNGIGEKCLLRWGFKSTLGTKHARVGKR